MTLNQRYRIHNIKNTYKSYLKLFIIIGFLIAFYYTFARYSNVFVTTSDLDIANWRIVINGTKIDSTTETIDNAIELKVDDDETDGIIRAGQTGYFDIEINPDGTEVAIEYQITMDFSEMPEEINMTSYAKMENGIIKDSGQIPADNKFSGEINLNTEENVKYRLDSRDTVTYRIYWTWSGEDFEIDYNDNYNVKSDLMVMQKV